MNCLGDVVSSGMDGAASRVSWTAAAGQRVLLADYRGLRRQSDVLWVAGQVWRELHASGIGTRLVHDLTDVHMGEDVLEQGRSQAAELAVYAPRALTIAPRAARSRRALADEPDIVRGLSMVGSRRAAGCALCPRGDRCPSAA